MKFRYIKVCPDGSIDNPYVYIDYNPTDDPDSVILDGTFDLETLKELVVYMESKQKSAENESF